MHLTGFDLESDNVSFHSLDHVDVASLEHLLEIVFIPYHRELILCCDYGISSTEQGVLDFVFFITFQVKLFLKQVIDNNCQYLELLEVSFLLSDKFVDVVVFNAQFA